MAAPGEFEQLRLPAVTVSETGYSNGMRALTVKPGRRGPLAVAEVPDPSPESDELLVEAADVLARADTAWLGSGVKVVVDLDGTP